MNSELYHGYRLPLRIEVSSLSFSNPENFVKKTNRDAPVEYAKQDDPDGVWMNAGAGGDSSTVDLALQLKDSDGKIVSSSEIIPLRLSLWCTIENKVINLLDEITQATMRLKSGHRKGEHGFLMLSNKPASKLYVDHNGKGQLSIRITTTSKLNDSRRFTVHVAPDYSIATPLSSRFKTIFSGQNCQKGDTVSSIDGFCRPLEVMSKVTAPRNKRKRTENRDQVLSLLEKASMNLKALPSKNLRQSLLDQVETRCMMMLEEVRYHKVGIRKKQRAHHKLYNATDSGDDFAGSVDNFDGQGNHGHDAHERKKTAFDIVDMLSRPLSSSGCEVQQSIDSCRDLDSCRDWDLGPDLFANIADALLA